MKSVIITTCKGRLHHLRLTLPSMLAQEVRPGLEVLTIVVEYNDPETQRWLIAGGFTHVHAGYNRTSFNLSHARNCGAQVCKLADLLYFVDADVILNPITMIETSKLFADPEVVLARTRDEKHLELAGTCVVRNSVFRKLNGYDESIQGWGCDDTDLYRRLLAHGREEMFSPTLLLPLWHNDLDRVAHYECKSKKDSQRANLQYLRARTCVNPTGWGIPSA